MQYHFGPCCVQTKTDQESRDDPPSHVAPFDKEEQPLHAREQRGCSVCWSQERANESTDSFDDAPCWCRALWNVRSV